MRKVPVRRAVLAVAMLSTVTTTGCFGSFPLTRKLYNYNNTFSKDKWMKELFFLATAVLLPVYGVASLIDVVILNSQEFWTGKSSMAMGPETKIKTVARGDVTIKQTMTQAPEGRTMIPEESVADKFRSRTTLHQATGSAVVLSEIVYADGRTEKKTLSVDEAGAMTISAVDGSKRTLSASEVVEIGSRLHIGAAAVGAN